MTRQIILFYLVAVLPTVIPLRTMTVTPDTINGCFELAGSFLIWVNIRALYKDKVFRGVRIGPTGFFFAWGLWNLVYYPYMHQYLSLAGGLSLVLANGVWVGQMIYYSRKEKEDAVKEWRGLPWK